MLETMVGIVGIVVTIISIIVTLISIVQTARKHKHQKSNLHWKAYHLKPSCYKKPGEPLLYGNTLFFYYYLNTLF